MLTASGSDAGTSDELDARSLSMNLKTLASVDWEMDNKTRARGWFTPDVAAVVANSPAGECQPKPQPVLLPYGNERFEQPIADTIGDSGTRVF